MTLEDLEFGLEGLLPKDYDYTLEAADQSALSPQEREKAISFFKKKYMGKYPIQYFDKNEKGKHDRIIAKIDIPEGESGKVFSFMKALVWNANKKYDGGKFFYSKKDGYVLVDPKRILKKPEKKVTKESTETGLEYLGVKDSMGVYEVENFRYLPLVQHYMQEGLNLKQAVDLMEANVLKYPTLIMSLIPESMFKSADDYDIYLIECFIALDELYPVMNEKETMENFFIDENAVWEVSESNIHMAMEAVTKNRNIVDKAKYKVMKSFEPIVKKAKEAVANLIGDKGVKEEVIKNSWWMYHRRMFIKLLLVYKSKVLFNAFLFFLPGGPIGLLLKLIFNIGRIFKMVGVAKDWVWNGGEDDQRKKVRKHCIAELQLELRITREKLEDAKASGDKKAKYDLMRVENAIEKEIDRITHAQDPDDSGYVKAPISNFGTTNMMGQNWKD